MPALEVPRRFDRSANIERAQIQEGARFLLRYLCERLGLVDLSGKDVLDVGCGTKFSQALLNNDVPIGSYTGVDVYREMIDFLGASVTDPRFTYRHVNWRNALYNPDGAPMTESSDLGVGQQTYDIIWLFSVFTHLDPTDYAVMLKLLRRYVRPGGRLFYTIYIDELTEDGYGFIDWTYRQMHGLDRDDPVDVERENKRRHAEPFVDVVPDDPLKIALYSREHAFELIEGTGWRPLELLPPIEHAQHQFICEPL